MILKIMGLLSLLAASFPAMSKDQYEWYATECAPKHYPMQIIRGTFIYHGEKERGLYIPSGGTLTKGWGDPISDHAVGKFKPLPDRLDITFFSYAEKQFYRGQFDLPYEKIKKLFEDGFDDGKRHETYGRIMTGIAPGGAVAVWLLGAVTVEVLYGQAQKVDLDPSRAFGVPFKDKEDSDEYIAKQLPNSLKPEEIESLKKNGIPFGLWARYRNRYNWKPVIVKAEAPDGMSAHFLNGESIADWYPDKEPAASLRPVIQRISFMTSVNGKKVAIQAEFDELETMAAFEKLGSKGEKVYLEFEPQVPRANTRIRLYNDKESIELKKFKT